MTLENQVLQVDGVTVVRLESPQLRVDVAPTVGGRVISVWNKALKHEFLWRSAKARLAELPPGSDYDSNFYGGIDELAPNDIPETVDGVALPDHGELWTLPLSWRMSEDRLILEGTMPKSQLRYQREMVLRPGEPCVDFHYRIENLSSERRSFLWKLHAAMPIAAGDVLECPARRGQVVDLQWSRYKTLAPFTWPSIEGQSADIVPPKDGTVDFFYLFDLEAGRVAWKRSEPKLEFSYEFDTQVFPYVWLFSSYGGFDGHYTAVLEPCTTMPISLVAAQQRGTTASLAPGESLSTTVTLRATSGE